ncbi:hypothetical protein AAKU55_005583 [Oxalobacteraceae bacterium GrIS 1.11]
MKFFHHLGRACGLYVLPLAVIGWLVYTDPDLGASTRDMLQGVAAGTLAITFMHLARRFLMPYIKLEKLLEQIMRGNTAAGVAFAGVMLFMSALLLMFAPRAHAGELETYIPSGAYRYAPVLKAEQMRIWPAHPNPAMLGALVEQESCVSLRSARCWSPTSRNLAPNEEGAGMGQITRTPRFDALREAKRLDPGLAGWSWANVYTRPDLQLRAIVAMNRDCDRRLSAMVREPQARLEMCDAAYNGGYGGLQADRRACGRRAGCDPQQWFGNVEQTCTKSRQAAAGYRRGPCVINREHVRMVAHVRRAKYESLMASR